VLPPGAAAAPFQVHVATAALAMYEDIVAFDLEVEVVNVQPGPAEGLRVALALISASPDQDLQRAAFHAGPPPQLSADPIALMPAGRARIPVRLTLRRDQLHVIALGGRPMFVGMLLCDLRWRGGLSVHRYGADFLLGAAGQGARPGPIWLDRPTPRALSAIAYTPQVT